MLRVKAVGGAVATVLGLAALLALGASASGETKALKLEVAGTGLVGGAPISASSSNLTLANAFWSLACSDTVLGGTMGANNRANNDYIPIAEGSLGGGGSEGLCASTFEFVTTWLPLSLQAPELQLNRKGQALLRFPRIKLVPLEDVGMPPGHKEACVASSNGIAGTFPVNEVPQLLKVTFSNAKMHLEADHGAECGHRKGAAPLLSGTFTFTSRGSRVEAVIFEHH
jgi:hypothetical protein